MARYPFLYGSYIHDSMPVYPGALNKLLDAPGLKPHPLESYMASNGPEFETKAADILGLYLGPPRLRALIVCARMGRKEFRNKED